MYDVLIEYSRGGAPQHVIVSVRITKHWHESRNLSTGIETIRNMRGVLLRAITRQIKKHADAIMRH